MSIRMPLLISLLLIAVMLAASVVGYSEIPDNARMAVHWGIQGNPDGFMPKSRALWFLPAIAAIVTLSFALMPRIEPRRANLLASRKLFVAAWIGAVAVIALSHVLTLMVGAGYAVDLPGAILVSVAVLIAVTGNFMGKSRSTFLIGGLKGPWSLSSEYAWEKSNRLAGRLFVLSALLTLAVYALAGVRAGFETLACTLVLSAVIGFAASYVYWKHDPDRQGGTLRE